MLFDIVMLIVLLVMFTWTVYNLPSLVVGVGQFIKKRNSNFSNASINPSDLPFFSLIVPMKDEHEFAARILRSLAELDYPRDKYEVIVVDDESVDGTSDICLSFCRAHPDLIRYVRKNHCEGKPSALNFGLKFVKGQIIGTFDADCVPKADVLLRAAEYFQRDDVVALQGYLSPLNWEKSMLSKFIRHEELVQRNIVMMGKDRLNLFIPLSGTCQFIRREVLEKLGGWSDGCLAEDMELSARLTEKGFRVKFSPEVQCWHEAPSKLKQLIVQRLRWFRGCMEVGLRYGRLLKCLNLVGLDAELYFTGSFVMILAFTTYILSLIAAFIPLSLNSAVVFAMQATSILNFLILFILGASLAFIVKPKKLSNIKWLPFIYLYWTLQIFLSFYAFLCILLRRPRRWIKTPRD